MAESNLEDVEKYRKSYELDHIWQLRRDFLKMYADRFDEDRLLCLSNVFVNVECMGLTYPDEVMKLIKELGSKIQKLEVYRHSLEQPEEHEEPLRRRDGRQQHRHYR